MSLSKAQWTVIWTVAILALGIWLAGADWKMAMASDRRTHLAYEAVKSDEARPSLRQLEIEVMALVSDQKASRARRDRIQAAREDVRTRSIISLLVFGGLLVGQLSGKRGASKSPSVE
jgi:hypothetical protein